MYEKQSIGRPIIETSPDWYVPLVGIAAHTIGHRKIIIFEDNIIIGDDNNDTSRTGLDSISISCENISANTTSNGIFSSNDSRSESDNIRQLVVVSVRGSVSLRDWAIINQGTVL